MLVLNELTCVTRLTLDADLKENLELQLLGMARTEKKYVEAYCSRNNILRRGRMDLDSRGRVPAGAEYGGGGGLCFLFE